MAQPSRQNPAAVRSALVPEVRSLRSSSPHQVDGASCRSPLLLSRLRQGGPHGPYGGHAISGGRRGLSVQRQTEYLIGQYAREVTAGITPQPLSAPVMADLDRVEAQSKEVDQLVKMGGLRVEPASCTSGAPPVSKRPPIKAARSRRWPYHRSSFRRVPLTAGAMGPVRREVMTGRPSFVMTKLTNCSNDHHDGGKARASAASATSPLPGEGRQPALWLDVRVETSATDHAEQRQGSRPS